MRLENDAATPSRSISTTAVAHRDQGGAVRRPAYRTDRRPAAIPEQVEDSDPHGDMRLLGRGIAVELPGQDVRILLHADLLIPPGLRHGRIFRKLRGWYQPGDHGYEADVTALERHLRHYGLGGATGVLDVLEIRREK